ncbi:Integrin alpha 3 [Fasciola gigantica]|uniref:Integrin alpha 3 n=1 Tax=Fasciola gigantica TaxID=46835 RepID=A0A504YZW6_FASGI|nr:Integrin alpha 3 [Fasciola gigantica]
MSRHVLSQSPDWAIRSRCRLNAVNRKPALEYETRNLCSAEAQREGLLAESADGSERETYCGNRTVKIRLRSTDHSPSGAKTTTRNHQMWSRISKHRCTNLCHGKQFNTDKIYCRIDNLSRGDAVRIVLRGHVWADTFFRYKIPDLAIVSEAQSELGEYAFGIPVHGNRTIQPLAISQNFVFHGIKVPAFREIPLWPIILGCILGAALLAGIIFGLWRCGFFRRKPIYDAQPASSGPIVSPTVL